jgi:hypothetical protein
VTSWCSAADVKALVQGNPSDALCQEFADEASAVLYILSGRQFAGRNTVAITAEVDRRGYVRLGSWKPVNAITAVADVSGNVLTAELSPGGTFAIVSPGYRMQYITLTLDVGAEPPTMGKRAAAALGADMLREDPRYVTTGTDGSTPDDVRVGTRITSISRQGVTFSYADISDLAKNNLTGIYEVDMFLRAANPGQLRHQPKVVTA